MRERKNGAVNPKLFPLLRKLIACNGCPGVKKTREARPWIPSPHRLRQSALTHCGWVHREDTYDSGERGRSEEGRSRSKKERGTRKKETVRVASPLSNKAVILPKSGLNS